MVLNIDISTQRRAPPVVCLISCFALVPRLTNRRRKAASLHLSNAPAMALIDKGLNISQGDQIGNHCLQLPMHCQYNYGMIKLRMQVLFIHKLVAKHFCEQPLSLRHQTLSSIDSGRVSWMRHLQPWSQIPHFLYCRLSLCSWTGK